MDIPKDIDIDFSFKEFLFETLPDHYYSTNSNPPVISGIIYIDNDEGHPIEESVIR
jgi:hypothetical protein